MLGCGSRANWRILERGCRSRFHRFRLAGKYLTDEVLVHPPLTGAGAAGESPGHRNAPAQRAGNDIASLPDGAGRVGENGEILFGEIEVAIFHARGQRRRELDVCADADTPAGL